MHGQLNNTAWYVTVGYRYRLLTILYFFFILLVIYLGWVIYSPPGQLFQCPTKYLCSFFEHAYFTLLNIDDEKKILLTAIKSPQLLASVLYHAADFIKPSASYSDDFRNCSFRETKCSSLVFKVKPIGVYFQNQLSSNDCISNTCLQIGAYNTDV